MLWSSRVPSSCLWQGVQLRDVCSYVVRPQSTTGVSWARRQRSAGHRCFSRVCPRCPLAVGGLGLRVRELHIPHSAAGVDIRRRSPSCGTPRLTAVNCCDATRPTGPPEPARAVIPLRLREPCAVTSAGLWTPVSI